MPSVTLPCIPVQVQWASWGCGGRENIGGTVSKCWGCGGRENIGGTVSKCWGGGGGGVVGRILEVL